MTACCWAGCLPVLTQSRSPYPKHSTADIAAWNLPSITLMHAHAFNHSSFVLHKGARERSSDGRKSSKRFRIERSTDVLCWRITLVISLLCAVDNGRIDRDPFGVEPSWPRRAATGDNVNKQPIFIDQPRRVCWPTFIIIWQIVIPHSFHIVASNGCHSSRAMSDGLRHYTGRHDIIFTHVILYVTAAFSINHNRIRDCCTKRTSFVSIHYNNI